MTMRRGSMRRAGKGRPSTRRPSTRRWLGLLAVAVSVPLVASACGGPSSNGEAAKAPTQILADAKQATLSASSVHVSGAGSDGNTPLKLDIVVSHGAGGGTISLSGGTVDVVLVGRTAYLKADQAFLRQSGASAAVAGLIGGRWLQTTTSDPQFGELAKLLDLASILQSLKPDGAIHKGKTTTFDHQSAVPLIDQSGGTLYVAGTGHPYILGVRAVKNGNGLLTFDQYGTAHPPAAPSGAINLQQLEKQGAA